jgi:hypothetical protein
MGELDETRTGSPRLSNHTEPLGALGTDLVQSWLHDAGSHEHRTAPHGTALRRSWPCRVVGQSSSKQCAARLWLSFTAGLLDR